MASIGTTTIATSATFQDCQKSSVRLPPSTSRLSRMLLTESMMNSSTTSTSPVTRVSTSPVRFLSW